MWVNSSEYDSGFTLIEVLFSALGLSLILAAAGVMILHVWRMDVSLNSMNSMEELHLELGRFLRNSDSCATTLGTLSFASDPLPISTFKNATGEVVFQVGMKYGPVSIASMQLTGFSFLDSQNGIERGISQMRVTYSRPPALGIGAPINVERSLALLITRQMAGTKEITACGATPLENWYRVAASSDIYSSGTRVGIGTNLPSVPLEVTSFPVSIGDQSVGGTKLIFDAVPGGYHRIYPSNPVPLTFTETSHFPQVTIDQNRIGIRAQPPLLALLDVGQDSPSMTRALYLSHGTIEDWSFSVSNAGQQLHLQRVGSANNGNFATLSPLAIKTSTLDPTDALRVQGTAGGSMPWASFSDRRLKADLQKLHELLPILKTLEKLRPVSYSLKSTSKPRLLYGFVAQELDKIFPELVVEAGSGLGVKLDNLVAFLIEATKSLDEKIQYEADELDQFLNQICQRHPREEVCRK